MSRSGDFSERPPSEQLADLHVYLVPTELWRDHLNSAVNQIINETISAGFIRVYPELSLSGLRQEIEEQIGDVIPTDYIFLKSVGRCLTRVQNKQEYLLKVKNFLPPQAYVPEIFILEGNNDDRYSSVLSQRDRVGSIERNPNSSGTVRSDKSAFTKHRPIPPIQNGHSSGTQTDPNVSRVQQYDGTPTNNTPSSPANPKRSRSPHHAGQPGYDPPLSATPPPGYMDNGMKPPGGHTTNHASENGNMDENDQRRMQELLKRQREIDQRRGQHLKELEALGGSLNEQDQRWQENEKQQWQHDRQQWEKDAQQFQQPNGPQNSSFYQQAPNGAPLPNQNGQSNQNGSRSQAGPGHPGNSSRHGTFPGPGPGHQGPPGTFPNGTFHGQSGFSDGVGQPARGQSAHVRGQSASRRGGHYPEPPGRSSAPPSEQFGYGGLGQQPGSLNAPTGFGNSIGGHSPRPVGNGNLIQPNEPILAWASPRPGEVGGYQAQGPTDLSSQGTYIRTQTGFGNQGPMGQSQDGYNQGPAGQQQMQAQGGYNYGPGGQGGYSQAGVAQQGGMPQGMMLQGGGQPMYGQALHQQAPGQMVAGPNGFQYGGPGQQGYESGGEDGAPQIQLYDQHGQPIPSSNQSFATYQGNGALQQNGHPGSVPRLPLHDLIETASEAESSVVNGAPVSSTDNSLFPASEDSQAAYTAAAGALPAGHQTDDPDSDNDVAQQPHPLRTPEMDQRPTGGDPGSTTHRRHHNPVYEMKRITNGSNNYECLTVREPRLDSIYPNGLDLPERLDQTPPHFQSLINFQDGTFNVENGGRSPSPTKTEIEQKSELEDELDAARADRKDMEKKREELIKRAKQLQNRTQQRRNQARDVWKKKYFDEKKKTQPLEEQSNKLRQELENLHRRIMSQLEGSKGEPKRPDDMKPSPTSNMKIQATRLQHNIEELERKVENIKMKLTSEMKLRNQAENELRALRAELTQKKINVTLTRSQQLAALDASSTPRSQPSTVR